MNSINDAMQLGAADYVMKPFNTEVLLKTIQKNLPGGRFGNI